MARQVHWQEKLLILHSVSGLPQPFDHLDPLNFPLRDRLSVYQPQQSHFHSFSLQIPLK